MKHTILYQTESAALFNSPHILNELPISVALVDLGYHYQFVNNTYIEWFGKSKAEIEGKHVQSIIGEKGFQASQKLFNRAFNGETIEFERDIPIQDNNHLILQVWYKPALDANQNIIGAYVFSHDITTSKTNQLNLQKSNQELEQFAYIASHDLKTPVRSLSMLAGYLLKKLPTLSSEEIKEHLASIEKNSQNLYRLIEDILEISQLRDHQIQLEKVDCMVILQELEAEFTQKHGASKVQIFYDNMPTVFADKQLLKMVFSNLIENSIKYNNSERAKILISSTTEHRYFFSIKDNGIGIAEEYHEKVFLLFKRLHHHETIAGTGVGLALCKRIINLLQGRIYINKAYKKGCEIHFCLPFIEEASITKNTTN